MGHVVVGWGGWLMQGWGDGVSHVEVGCGGSCRGVVGHVGVGWGVSCICGVGHVGVGWGVVGWLM